MANKLPCPAARDLSRANIPTTTPSNGTQKTDNNKAMMPAFLPGSFVFLVSGDVCAAVMRAVPVIEAR
jgi:hypothetical protein